MNASGASLLREIMTGLGNKAKSLCAAAESQAFSNPAYFSINFFCPKPGKLTVSFAPSPVPLCSTLWHRFSRVIIRISFYKPAIIALNKFVLLFVLSLPWFDVNILSDAEPVKIPILLYFDGC